MFALILNISPVEIVLDASNAPINNTLPPDPTTSKAFVKCVAIKICVIVLLPLVHSRNSIAFVFLQVCVSADSAVSVQSAWLTRFLSYAPKVASVITGSPDSPVESLKFDTAVANPTKISLPGVVKDAALFLKIKLKILFSKRWSLRLLLPYSTPMSFAL